MIECLKTFTSQPSLSGNINAPLTQNTDMAESISEQNVPLPTEEHPTSISVETVEGAPTYPSSFTVTPKLPKLVLQKFNGEITKFRTFWDRFDSSVNKNPNISPIDKFNYFQGLLEGPAARVIQGLPLTLFVPEVFHVDMTGGALIGRTPSEILSISCHYPISFIFSKFYLSLT